MKANELRIGNYLNGKQGHVVISEIRINNSVKIHDNTSSFSVGICLTPIELTEEWLEKLGFKCILDISYSFPKPYDNLELAYYGSINGFKKGWVINKLFGLSNGIKYVHELQNLYFALTGEELTVEL